ncbi:MAG: glycoside hydrolase family 27 protein [bacterium]
MNKSFLYVLSAILFLAVSCTSKKEPSIVSLDMPWKFKMGDSIEWAQSSYSDSVWSTIMPNEPWERQGFKRHDGFAWYRITVVIPSSLKDKSYFKDSLQFYLGKIDDYDQVFLNGELIGENNRHVTAGKQPGNAFTGEVSAWYIPRRYVLAANDPRIKWDQENIVAIRVYDSGGAGGLFEKPFEISMADLKDYLHFHFDSTGFEFGIRDTVTKKFSLANSSSTETFQGLLSIRVKLASNGNTVFRKDTLILLEKKSKSDFSFSVVLDLSMSSVAEISFTEGASSSRVSGILELPYILTPPPPQEPLINGARVFGVRPYAPFFFKIPATGAAPLRYFAENLPEELRIDENTGIIRGYIAKKGSYLVSLCVENEFGKDERTLRLEVGNLIALTPPLGWNSWNCWGLSVSDRKVRSSALAMKESGLIDHGWTYINIDDGWEDTHMDGKIVPNEKFPDMKALCWYVHSLGLKIGIYSSPGPKTCGGYEGSYGFEKADAKSYAEWGFDYLKYDWCSYFQIAPNPNRKELEQPYHVMEKALRTTGRDIHYSLCQYGMGNVWEWGASVGGNSWRTTGDIEDTWESMSGIGFRQNECSPYASPGYWNDPDMLVVGWVGWGPNLHYTRLTPNEQYTHITLWCMLASPLLLGNDLSQLDPFTLGLLTNDQVLAVNQDPLGKQAIQMKKTPEYQLWMKAMEDSSKVIGLFNLTEKPLYIPVDLVGMGFDGRYGLRDLWRQKDLGEVERLFEMRVEPHGASLINLRSRD